jgi:hypothetical protein
MFLDHLNIDINDPSNLLLLHSVVRKALDRFGITIIPQDHDTFLIRVLNPVLLSETVQSHAGTPIIFWRDLNNKPLEWTSSHHHAKKLCAFHAKVASLHACVRGGLQTVMSYYRMLHGERQVMIKHGLWTSF